MNKAEFFDIKQHILSHDKKTLNVNMFDSKDEFLHFKFSIDSLQFLQNNLDIDQTMNELIDSLNSSFNVQTKNGFYHRKDGTKRQKYKNIKIDLSDSLISYHKDSFDGLTVVEPHIHLLIPKNKNYGYRFQGLKNIINHYTREKNLIPHFAEKSANKSTLTKAQKRLVSRFSWQIQKRDDDSFRVWVESDQFREQLELFYRYIVETKNLLYQAKTINALQRRLQRLEIDFYFAHQNIKRVPFMYMPKEELEVLEHIADGKFAEYNYPRSSILAREYIKHNMSMLDNYKNTESELIRTIEKSLKHKLPKLKKEEVLKASKLISAPTPKQKTNNNKNDRLIKQILNSAKMSKNEKEFKTRLGELLNDDRGSVSMRIRDGHKVGFKVQRRGKLQVIYFDNIGLSYKKDILPEIRRTEDDIFVRIDLNLNYKESHGSDLYNGGQKRLNLDHLLLDMLAIDFHLESLVRRIEEQDRANKIEPTPDEIAKSEVDKILGQIREEREEKEDTPDNVIKGGFLEPSEEIKGIKPRTSLEDVLMSLDDEPKSKRGAEDIEQLRKEIDKEDRTYRYKREEPTKPNRGMSP